MHYVYLMASRPRGAIYVGRSSNLRARVEAHRAGMSVHTAKYNINTLVWFEAHESFDASLQRERSIKRWRRAWKDALVEGVNPDWRDVTHLVPD